jgi:threonine aldolase
MDYLQQATDLARARGLATHLDGARLFNAAVATAAPGESVASAAKSITSLFDSVSVCFSKGLGAPVGSALCGSKALIARAHRIRKMAGGGMRQVGLLAAAASYALDHHLDRLADDHALAQRLAQGLQGIEGMRVRSVSTNIVFLDVADGRGADLLVYLKEHGVLATGMIGLRFVTHLDVNAADMDHTVACVRRFFDTQPTSHIAPKAAGVY